MFGDGVNTSEKCHDAVSGKIECRKRSQTAKKATVRTRGRARKYDPAQDGQSSKSENGEDGSQSAEDRC